jgi:hypothetical protein
MDQSRVSGHRERADSPLLPFLWALWVSLDRMASLLSMAILDRLRLFPGIMGVPMRGIGLVRGVLVVLALVVFLSSALGHLVFPLIGFLKP